MNRSAQKHDRRFIENLTLAILIKREIKGRREEKKAKVEQNKKRREERKRRHEETI